DGIRDATVTGVQTCALPISQRIHRKQQGRQDALEPEAQPRPRFHVVGPILTMYIHSRVRVPIQLRVKGAGCLRRSQRVTGTILRSEERRVGKEGRYGYAVW